MNLPRLSGWLRCGASFLAGPIVELSVFAAGTPPPTTQLSGLVEKLTEESIAKTALPASQPGSQSIKPPAAQPSTKPIATKINPDSASKKAQARKPSPPLASLPTPKAASGPLRILVVDDDWDNNSPGAKNRLTASDEIFRTLVAAAVGGDAAAWSVVIVERYKDGPGIEQLRNYNVVLWYTGASHGADPTGASTLSREDEKTVRRYLQEVGGSFILVSPGFANNLSYVTSWTDSPHQFLKEVVGSNGLAGFAQRGAGTVRAHDGSTYNVLGKGATGALFSAVNPDGAAIVFTASLDPLKTAKEPVPVAVANPFGGGRFVYVGFTFENIAEKARSNAFGILLDAALGSKGTAGPVAGPTDPVAGPPGANLPPRELPKMPDPGTPTVEVSGTPNRTIVSRTDLPEPAIASPPTTTANDDENSILGTWIASSGSRSTYATINGISGYIKRQYTFNDNGTYTFIIKTFQSTSDRLLLTRESGAFQISGNNITINPDKSVIEAWSKKDGGDKWGGLLSTQKRMAEKTIYTFTKHYFSGIQQWNLVLQADKTTERDGPFSTNTTFENAYYYADISSNNPVIALPGG